MGSQQSWQKLIAQALTETSIDVHHGNKCTPLCVYEYIYRALNLAGISNRPPFGWYQIFSIWWRAHGDAKQIKLLCIQAIQQLKTPVAGFKPNSGFVELFSIALLSFVLLPQTANTFINSPTQHSILHIKPRPMEDIDTVQVTLPSSTDYIYAANQFTGKPVLYARDRGVLGIEWIHNQQDSTYSLQVVSTSTREAIFEFCKEHNICDKSAYYQSQIQGKTYFRLLYGSFSSHKAAQLARAKLPDKLRQLEPWPRNFKQIKSEL
jgi:hypothetical protein